jgi:hypothetical protein
LHDENSRMSQNFAAMHYEIALGFLLAGTICFDMCKQKKKVYTKIVVSVFISSTTTYGILSSTSIFSKTSNGFTNNAFNVPGFTVSFVLSLIADFCIIYFTFFQQWLKAAKGSQYPVHFFDFLIKGYDDFIKDVKAQILKRNRIVNLPKQENAKIASKHEPLDLAEIFKTPYKEKIHQTPPKYDPILDQKVKDFIDKITSYAKLPNKDIDGFLGYVSYGLIEEFLNANDARFTLRRNNGQKNAMVPFFTTSEGEEQGEISLDGESLILQSMRRGHIPLIYSENKNFHYSNTKGSIANGIFEDYCTLCFKSEGGRPIFSLCLEVKGQEAIDKMHQLVRTPMLSIIGSAFAVIFNERKEKNLMSN